MSAPAIAPGMLVRVQLPRPFCLDVDDPYPPADALIVSEPRKRYAVAPEVGSTSYHTVFVAIAVDGSINPNERLEIDTERILGLESEPEESPPV